MGFGRLGVFLVLVFTLVVDVSEVGDLVFWGFLTLVLERERREKFPGFSHRWWWIKRDCIGRVGRMSLTWICVLTCVHLQSCQTLHGRLCLAGFT